MRLSTPTSRTALSTRSREEPGCADGVPGRHAGASGGVLRGVAGVPVGVVLAGVRSGAAERVATPGKPKPRPSGVARAGLLWVDQCRGPRVLKQGAGRNAADPPQK
jgi:hypothetical protein